MLLIVDDNKKAAEALGKLLTQDGYKVSFAYDGETAIALAQRSNPDAIILDIDLPGKDGYEVARILKYELNSPATLIALTGYYGRREDKQTAKDAGFDHHLTKPILVADIERLLTTPSRNVARGLNWS